MKRHIEEHPYISCLVSGILAAVPFLIPQLFLLEWVALIPYLYIIMQVGMHPSRMARATLIFSAAMYLPIYIWFYWLYPLDFVGFTALQSLIVVFAAHIGFSGLMVIPFMLFVPLWKLSRPGISLLLPLSAAAWWTVIEAFQGWFLTGLPWSRICISQYMFLPAIQSSALFGELFVSFLIVLVNALLAYSLMLERARRTAIAAAGLFSINLICGFVRMLAIPVQSPYDQITFAIVQGNMLSGEKWADGASQKAFDLYCDETEKLAEQYEPDFIVWPESAVPLGVVRDSKLQGYYQKLAESTNTNILMGAFFIDADDKNYNAIMAYTPDGKWHTPYSKRHLVPFGEYLPARDILTKIVPSLGEINQLNDDLTQGTDPDIITIGDVKVGGLVCFDSIFPDLARKSVNAGANILVLVTNDSWYKDSIGVYHHNAQSVFRAIENNRYVVRAANSGISCVIAPDGQITAMLPPLVKDNLVQSAWTIDTRTPYSYIGDTWVWLCAVYCVGLLLYPFGNWLYYKFLDADFSKSESDE